uniref:Uncharacterized protein n=1 Tax=Amphora coffeiformis TaxID=265554 RepID=A0A7S3P4L1_9STRA|mmetsp:Transcript_5768/g.11529  ORF Transcript_5768/g.11529 Transcript_5768/m.11529 type:complete len:475 (+) Transcript_5768:378-1802(+)
MVKIRGFLSGKSRRERKEKKKEAKNGAENGTMEEGKAEGDDQSTVYKVDVDDGSIDAKDPATLAAKSGLLNKDGEDEEETDFFNEHDAAAKKYLLKLVLLLMDSNSRRFELLQLEFDSVQASVSDVLAQIPVAVTEVCLKEQTYKGISSCDGNEKKPEDVLAKFCKGGDVMVAVADDMTAADYVKLALPILSDPKVVAMLKHSGIDASPWREARKNAKLAAKREKQAVAEKKKSTTKEKAPEAAPTKENKAFNSKSAQNAKVGSSTRSAPVAESPAPKASKPVIVFHPNNDTASTSRGIHVSEVHSTSSRGSKSGLSFITLLIVIVAVILLSTLLALANMYISAPIQVGHVLAPGTVLHKCGFAGVIPGVQSILSAISPRLDCKNSYLVVEDEQVTGYDSDGNVAWMIVGTHHTAKRVCDVENEEDCMKGLHFVDDKHLLISGTKITWIETFEKGVDVYPWPFEEKPLTRIWKK